ncbi:DUF1127 domain-containing protein [Marinomonas gallaica]|uniref:DUF1127 domain-containing protein n=1 Tax=Marinomonas gallaica TaxID=1806667 RepID=UPI003CE47338
MKTNPEVQLKCVNPCTIGVASNERYTLGKIKINAWKQLFKKVAHNWRTRSRLHMLNESQLKDIGLTAADVDQETHKPLWK